MSDKEFKVTGDAQSHRVMVGATCDGMSRQEDVIAMRLATTALEMNGSDRFSVSADLDASRPETLQAFKMFQSMLMMAYRAGQEQHQDELAEKLLERGGFGTLQLNARPHGIPRMQFVQPEEVHAVSAAKIGGAIVVKH